MSLSMPLESLKGQIIQKSWEESAFKKALLNEPKKASKEAFGVDLPAEIELKVVEESSSLIYLTLPPNPEDVANGVASPKTVW